MSGEELAPIVACIGVFGIPIVAILTSHQRKMAMLFHGQLNQSNQNQPQSNTDALAAEVNNLKQIVYQQSIAIDSISSKLDRIAANTDVQNRLSGTQT